MTAQVKIEALQVGDSFISKGSKMKVARVKSQDETTITLFCLNYILSSYISVKFNRSQMVTLFTGSTASRRHVTGNDGGTGHYDISYSDADPGL